MSEENGWVKLPAGCPWLPEGTRILYGIVRREHVAVAEVHQTGAGRYRGRFYRVDDQHTSGDATMSPEVIQGVILPDGYRFVGSEAVRTEDDLGDTPEHLRPLLKAARERVRGTVITEVPVRGWDVLWSPDPTKMGYPTFLRAAPSNCGYRVDAPPGTAPQPRSDLRKEILEGRCYPTADARRIGREEFGLTFDTVMTSRGPATVVGEAANREPDVVLTSPIFAPACACGATSNLRSVKKPHTSEFHGVAGMVGTATTMYTETTCGPCYQSKRRAELQAAKVEQLKGEMGRKVTPKWCEAPRGWPVDAGEDYEL